MGKLFISLVILFLTCNLAIAQEKPHYVMKLCAIAPEGTSWAEVADKFADDIYRDSGGRLKTIWYLGGSMGDELATVKKVRLGQLQGGVFTLTGLAKIVPEVSVLALPNLFKDYDEVDYVLEKMTPALTRMFDENGFVLFGWIEVGFAYFFSKKPIHNLAEIKETKVWYWAGDPLQKEIFEMEGYKNLIPLELFEVLTALHTGLVETFFVPHYACLALQWYQYAKYVNTKPFVYTPGGMFVTKKFFDGLPPDIQDIVLKASKKYLPLLTPIIRRDHERSLEGFIKEGMKVLKTTPEIEEQYEKEAREIYEKLGDKYFPKWLLAGILNARARFRAGITE